MKVMLIAAVLILLAACSKPLPPQSDSTAGSAPATAQTAHVATLLDPLLKDRDKATAVEKQLLDADKQRRKKIDQASD